MMIPSVAGMWPQGLGFKRSPGLAVAEVVGLSHVANPMDVLIAVQVKARTSADTQRISISGMCICRGHDATVCAWSHAKRDVLAMKNVTVILAWRCQLYQKLVGQHEAC
jgi:hypothetical protein